MKLSSASFLLILLSCALLLNHVSGAENPSLNPPQQKVDEQRDKAGNQEQTKANEKEKTSDTTVKPSPLPPPAAGQKSEAATNPDQSSASKKADSSDPNQQKDWFDWYTLFGPATWANWAVTLLAIVAAIVGFLNLRFIGHQLRLGVTQLKAARIAANAARTAAIAAKESAELANKALHTDRPYLLIEDIKLRGINIPSELGLVAAWIVVSNCGKGPALVDEAIREIRIVDGELPARNYSGCTELGAPDIIRPGQSLTDSLMVTLKSFSDTERDKFLAGDDRKNLVVYGRITYRDLMDGKYTEGFYWQAGAFSTRIRMRVDSAAEPKMKRGPKTHNYHE